MAVKPMRHQQSGLGTIEVVVALSLFGLALVGLFTLHMVALSGGTIAETSSVATNLARARLEALLTLPPAEVVAQNGTETQQVPPGRGRAYQVRTTVDSSDPDRLDITVTVTWQVATVSGCAGEPGAGCTGSTTTRTRMLQTRLTRF
jgi:Tfp pilus assembly protein PilV